MCNLYNVIYKLLYVRLIFNDEYCIYKEKLYFLFYSK